MSAILRFCTFSIVVTGCMFTPPDLDLDSGADTEIPPGMEPVPRHCATAEPALVLCVDFEDPSLASAAIDGSDFGNDAVATNVTAMPRITGEQAAELKPMSSLHVPESPMLDVDDFTIEMWIAPKSAPRRREVAGLFDNLGQYTMQLDEDREIQCGLGTIDTVGSEARVPLNMWSHVACRYTAGEMRVYVNGHVSDCKTYGTPVGHLGVVGSTIGSRVGLAPNTYTSRLVGGIDNVRVYSAALDDAQLCAAAGQQAGTCRDVCPTSGDDD